MKTIAFIAFIGIALAIHVMASYNVVRMGRDYYAGRIEKCPSPKVFDIAHKTLPNLSQIKSLHVLYDIIAAILLGLPLLLHMTVFYAYWFLMIAIRGLVNVVTILPKDKSCNDADYMGVRQIFGHCYDKIFSGHFATAILFGILLHRFYPQMVPLWMVLLGLLAYAVLILATRAHYTIDLIVSVFVVLSILQIRFDV